MQFEPRIAVIGLGYVGLPLALSLARTFPTVVGFDISEEKIELLKKGIDPTREGLEGEIKGSKLHATNNSADLKGCNFFIVGVPTPIDQNHNPDLRALRSASETVGKNISKGGIVVFESTVYPGLTREICGPIIEAVSGLKQGKDFKLGYSPERINPGDAKHTLENVVKVVAGEDNDSLEKIAAVYGKIIKAGIHRAPSIEVAEAAKVIENTQRDLNIALMNELAIIFDKIGICTKDVLEAAGTKWNFLKFLPGLVGGHCIGVDPYYLTTKAEELGYHPQVILAGRRINDEMGKWVANRLVKLLINAGFQPKGARVAILGLTFKENVADIRNSRIPDMYKELREFGVIPIIVDPLADPKEAHEEYGVNLHSIKEVGEVVGAIYAVPHRQFEEMPISELTSMVTKGGVIVDIKSCLKPSELPSHLTYWSL